MKSIRLNGFYSNRLIWCGALLSPLDVCFQRIPGI